MRKSDNMLMPRFFSHEFIHPHIDASSLFASIYTITVLDATQYTSNMAALWPHAFTRKWFFLAIIYLHIFRAWAPPHIHSSGPGHLLGPLRDVLLAM